MYHQKETPPTIYAISHQGGENMDLIKYFILGIGMTINAMIYLIGTIVTFIQNLASNLHSAFTRTCDRSLWRE